MHDIPRPVKRDWAGFSPGKNTPGRVAGVVMLPKPNGFGGGSGVIRRNPARGIGEADQGQRVLVVEEISPAKIGVLVTAFSSLEHVIHHRHRLAFWLFILTAGLAEIISKRRTSLWPLASLIGQPFPDQPT